MATIEMKIAITKNMAIVLKLSKQILLSFALRLKQSHEIF